MKMLLKIGFMSLLAYSTFASNFMSPTVLDAGGGHSTSLSYANDGSIGGFGGITTGNPQDVARTGYAGQLYEVTAFTLSAASTNLNAATSIPLYAIQFLDDGTVSPANIFAQWSFAGPVNVDGNGIVTATMVSQNASGVVQASFEGWSASLNLWIISMEALPRYNQMLGQIMSNGQMRLSFVGSIGGQYALDRTFNLFPANWAPQITNSTSAGSMLMFTNIPVHGTNNFWRVRLVP